MKQDQSKTTSIHTHILSLPAARKTAGLIAGIMSSFVLASTCMAADRQDTSASARYEYERSLCNKGQTNQAKETCLREAGAAKQHARQGALTTLSEEQLQRNRESRCVPIPQKTANTACNACAEQEPSQAPQNAVVFRVN